MVDALREHAGVELRKVANMLANLALAVERGRRAVDRVRLDQHLAHIVQRLPRRIADFQQLLGIAKLRQQMCDVAHDLRVANSNLLGIMPADQFTKQLLQRMRLRNFHGPTSLPNRTPMVPYRNGTLCGLDTLNPDSTQVPIRAMLWSE